eukprot:UC1_evm1s1992
MRQAHAVLQQVCAALAVAEAALEFEHRDLHISNILVKTCNEDAELEYALNGENFQVPTEGVQASIIDFTLSRMRVPTAATAADPSSEDSEDKVHYLDLEQDAWIFDGMGDLQFDVYRKMRKITRKDWRAHRPKTNIYWLHYLLDKCLTAFEYAVEPTEEERNTFTKCRARIQRLGSARRALRDPFFAQDLKNLPQHLL